MKMLFVVAAIAAGAAAVVVLRRRSGEQNAVVAPAAAAPATEQPPVPSAQTERIADKAGAVPDQGVREEESAQTDETKYERLVERESEERHAAAERLLADPLTERLAADA